MANALQVANSGFRTTSAGMKLGQLIFNPAAPVPSPVQITSLLRQAGLKIPVGVSVGVDVAQIVMSGGTLMQSVDAGASVGACLAPSANIMKAGLDLFEVTGLLDPKSPPAQLLNLGADTALVVSSGGLNVLADIALVFDFIGGLFSAPDDRPQTRVRLRNQDIEAAQSWFKTREMSQGQAAAQAFSSFQTGRMTVFEMMGSIAQNAPDLFLNYFPSMKAFVPPITATKGFSSTATASYGGFFGIGRQSQTITDTFTFSYQTIDNDKSTIQTAFVDKYIVNPYTPYRKLATMNFSEMQKYGFPVNATKLGVFDHENPVYPRIHLMDMAILSMFPPYFDYLHDDFDIRRFLKALLLTPNDFGSDLLQDESLRAPAIEVNGIPFYMPSDWQSNLSLPQKEIEFQLAMQFDKQGDINHLLMLPRASRNILEWGIMPYLEGQMEGKMPGNYANLPISSPMGYRNIRNYWSAISMADYMSKDPYFGGFNVYSMIQDFLSTKQDLEDRFRRLQFLSVGRHLNLQARSNIARYYNIAPGKLKLTPLEAGKRVYIQ